MAQSMTLGDAVKAYLTHPDRWGDLWDETDDEKLADEPMMGASVETVRRQPFHNTKQILENFTGDLLTDEQAHEWLEGIAELAEKTTTTTKAGDKWAGPGRIVCSWPGLDPTARLVMFVVAAHGDNNGKNIYVSQERIRDYLGLKSTEPVRRAWRRLEKAGAITKTEKDRPHRAARWKINKGPRTV